MNKALIPSGSEIALHDVVLIGYGPVSQTLALALGRRGFEVSVFEKREQRYSLPRAVSIDHEASRILFALGLGGELPLVSETVPKYQWFNGDWKQFFAIDMDMESTSGGPGARFVHQPSLEKLIDESIYRYLNIDVNMGWEAVEVSQTENYAEVVLRNVITHKKHIVRAKYVIGADGANSMVRSAIGSTQANLGFEADWLVLDVLPNEGVDLDIPPAAQHCNPARPTAILPGGVENGRRYRRWEFMCLPGETSAQMEAESVAWDLLAPWVKPGEAKLVRQKVYTFRSLVANSWRKGRLLIAGDAAHVMPPFMGQGMCSGMRDSWNLAWKLDLVLNGQSTTKLLDTYQQERRPHVIDVTGLSMHLGRLSCVTDPREAAGRDAAIFAGKMPPPAPFPFMTDGILHRDETGAVLAPAGVLGPQGILTQFDVRGRCDEIVGLGFTLISRSETAEAELGDSQREFLNSLGAHRIHVVAPGQKTKDLDAYVDVDAKYFGFLDKHGVDTILVRPDFYLYGGIKKDGNVNALVDGLAHDLQTRAVRGLSCCCETKVKIERH